MRCLFIILHSLDCSGAEFLFSEFVEKELHGNHTISTSRCNFFYGVIGLILGNLLIKNCRQIFMFTEKTNLASKLSNSFQPLIALRFRVQTLFIFKFLKEDFNFRTRLKIHPNTFSHQARINWL